jgi:hypothetical protein
MPTPQKNLIGTARWEFTSIQMPTEQIVLSSLICGPGGMQYLLPHSDVEDLGSSSPQKFYGFCLSWYWRFMQCSWYLWKALYELGGLTMCLRSLANMILQALIFSNKLFFILPPLNFLPTSLSSSN